VTRNPNAIWVGLQLHQAWECGEPPQRFVIFDRDAKFSADVVSTVKAMGSEPIRRIAVLGRTELRNAGLAVYVASSWIM
jgi:hypothetical protein